ncbi:MAG: transporter family protein [Bacillales bacterium]|jgi:ABC-2 type transport system ATP-binding protein|nr:transporter family protein [Bacillales bacterium]
MENNTLVVKNLSKSFGNRKIIDDVSFEVNKGEIFGFLGPNGAGKTTIIRMLVGLIKPTEGKIYISGFDVRKDYKKAMSRLGCIVENPELYSFLTGWENLMQFARMIGLNDENKILEIVNLVKLDQRIHDKVKTYSLGMKQRLGIAQALLNDPDLLILDEPTNGLDPAGIRELRDFIKRIVKFRNMSVFISSHLLSEIEMMCDTVAIIHKGKLIKQSPVSDLLEETQKVSVWEISDVNKGIELLKKVSRNVIQISDTTLKCEIGKNEIPEIINMLINNDILIYNASVVQESLEDLFIRFTGEETND